MLGGVTFLIGAKWVEHGADFCGHHLATSLGLSPRANRHARAHVFGVHAAAHALQVDVAHMRGWFPFWLSPCWPVSQRLVRFVYPLAIVIAAIFDRPAHASEDWCQAGRSLFDQSSVSLRGIFGYLHNLLVATPLAGRRRRLTRLRPYGCSPPVFAPAAGLRLFPWSLAFMRRLHRDSFPS